MKTVTSVCTYCGTGCDIVAEIEHDTVQRITAHPQGKVSRGKLCVKGKLGFDFLYSPNRIRAARIKRSFIDKHRENFPPAIRSKLFLLREFDTEWFECDYDIGYRIAGWALERVRGAYGPESIACIGGARTSCENGYFFQKFARKLIGTPHVDNCARVCHSPSLAGMKRTIGEGAATNPFDDILGAQSLIVIGSNTTEAHPIVSHQPF